MTIAGHTFTVAQDAAPPPNCIYAISPEREVFRAPGGTGSINVTAAGGCPWQASSNVDWITLGSATTGSGNGSFSYTVSPNTTGDKRKGKITVAGEVFVVKQKAT